MRRSVSLALAAVLLIPSAAIAAPVARAGKPTLCSYGSRVYSPFYALRITAPEHLPIAKGGHVVRCRVAFAVATLAKAARLNALNFRAKPGRFTLVVGGQKPSSAFPYSAYWRLEGRATCNYRVVRVKRAKPERPVANESLRENTHTFLMVRCTHGATVVTFSVPPNGDRFG